MDLVPQDYSPDLIAKLVKEKVSSDDSPPKRNSFLEKFSNEKMVRAYEKLFLQ